MEGYSLVSEEVCRIGGKDYEEFTREDECFVWQVKANAINDWDLHIHKLTGRRIKRKKNTTKR